MERLCAEGGQFYAKRLAGFFGEAFRLTCTEMERNEPEQRCFCLSREIRMGCRLWFARNPFGSRGLRRFRALILAVGFSNRL